MPKWKSFRKRKYKIIIIHETYGFEKSFLDKNITSLKIPVYPDRKSKFFFESQILIKFVQNIFNKKLNIAYKENFFFNYDNKFDVIKYFIKYLYVIYIYSAIDHFNPKLVLTTIDNSSFFYKLAFIDKKRKYIAVQNGMRHSHCYKYKYPGKFKYESLTYFCFGKRDIQNFSKFNHNTNNFVISGSPKSSFIKEKIYCKNVVKKKKFDICLISQWTDVHIRQYESNNFENKLAFEHIKNYIQLLPLLSQYLKINKLRFAIALRTDTDEEYFFYKNYFKFDCFIQKNRMDEFSSYKLAIQSKLILGRNSTMLSELLSWGEKVLYCNPGKEEAFRIDLKDLYFEGTSFREFSEKVNFILTNKISHFDSDFKKANYINYSDPNNLSHLIIKKHILENIK